MWGVPAGFGGREARHRDAESGFEGFGQSLFGGFPTQYAAECQQEEERTAVGWVARWARMARREGQHDADEGGKGVFEAGK